MFTTGVKYLNSEIKDIYSRHYGADGQDLLATVLTHSEAVARMALVLAERFPEADKDFILRAAMLHDIGVVKCHAPSIGAKGSLPYICHGIEGRKILESENLVKEALVCERHTGSGITAQEIAVAGLPLPHRDMLPLSIEEKIICYADCFFSKSGDLTFQKPIEKVMQQMATHGKEPLNRFLRLHSIFST